MLLAARVLRSTGFGFSAILIGVHLESRGLSSAGIGIILAVGLAAASLTGLAAAALSGRLGRRRVLSVIGLLMAGGGLLIAFGMTPPLFVLASLTGMLGFANADLGPFLVVEQAMLTEATDARQRNRAFGRYSFTGAIGVAAGGLMTTVGTGATTAFYLLFAVLGLITAVLPFFLSPSVEGSQGPAPAFGNLRPLVGLAALFGLDSLGGGLVVNSVIVYWLHIRYGVGPEILGPSFAVMSILNALSLEAAGRVAERIGLVNTMVFTHLPSNLLLVLVPFVPHLWWALGLLLVRAALVTMDQPARQAYVVSIVPPNERTGALAITGGIRGLALAAGPAVTGAAIQSAALGIPFYAGGAIKCLYDLLLWAGFRRRFGDHEVALRT